MVHCTELFCLAMAAAQSASHCMMCFAPVNMSMRLPSTTCAAACCSVGAGKWVNAQFGRFQSCFPLLCRKVVRH